MNVLTYDSIDYIIESINPKFPYSKGGNSSVFKLVDNQKNSELVVKFSKYNLRDKEVVANNALRIERFDREIEALYKAKDRNFNFVISIQFDGTFEIGNQEYRFFAMEKAQSDLTEFLAKEKLSIQQRFVVCNDILKGIKELHSQDIYHRDIKPDNILFVDKTWKISDLGLIAYRNDDFEVREIGEKIGPANWMSPEAMNKMYNQGKGKLNAHGFDCNLDNLSDIFQLGKLFWFVFQGNVPEGQLVRGDFKIDDQEIYEVIYRMLTHSKTRPDIAAIEAEFAKRYSAYAI